jgi:hypothetical protein
MSMQVIVARFSDYEGAQGAISQVKDAGRKVEAVGITDDLKAWLENLAPAGVEVSEDGTATAV